MSSSTTTTRQPQANQTDDIDVKSRNQTLLMSRAQVEAEYGISRRWLEQAALTGNGPSFIKIARRTVRYRRDDLERWLADREVQSTADRPKANGPSLARQSSPVELGNCPGAIAIKEHLENAQKEPSND